MSKEFEELKLEHPTGEDGEVVELGEARKGTILWPKEFIVLPNWPPRPSIPQIFTADSPVSSATVLFAAAAALGAVSTASPVFSAALSTAASVVSAHSGSAYHRWYYEEW